MKIGVTLSGGFVKGVAHIGFLKALEEKGIVPSVVSGASAGAVVGLLYCAGYSPEKIFELAKNTKWRELAKPCLRGGFFKLSGLEERLRELLGNITFSELTIPLTVTVVNLKTLKVEFINDGDVVKATVASCSAPPLFAPVKIGKNYYADGGIRNCLPAEAPKVFGCSINICSNANAPSKKFNPNSILDVSLRASLAGILENQEPRHRYCDITVSYTFDCSQFDFSNVEKFFAEGYEKTLKAIEGFEKWL